MGSHLTPLEMTPCWGLMQPASHAGLSARHVKMRLALPCLGHGWASAFRASRISVLSSACRYMDSQVRKQIALSASQV